MVKRAGLVIVALAAPAAAQSVNVKFGEAANAPAPTYAAAGGAGTWNAVTGVAGPEYALVTTDGAASSISVRQSPTTGLLTGGDAAVHGDDAKLLNTGLVTTSDETCLTFVGFEPGDYEVLIYAWEPNAPGVKSRTRQDEAPATVDVGGAWTGAHAEGVTFARYRVTVDATGVLPAHSGKAPGQPSATLNGVQIRPWPTAMPPDAGPVTGGADASVDEPETPPDPTTHDDGCSAGGGGGGAGLVLAIGWLIARRRDAAR